MSTVSARGPLFTNLLLRARHALFCNTHFKAFLGGQMGIIRSQCTCCVRPTYHLLKTPGHHVISWQSQGWFRVEIHFFWLFEVGLVQGCIHICDAIKQNESKLEKNKKSVFNVIVCFNFRALSLKKTSSTFSMRFLRYSLFSMFSVAQSNQIQRKPNTIIKFI